MAIKETVTCDVCGKTKRDVNHWWIANVFMQFQLFKWSDDVAKERNSVHLCGQECASKKLNEWMQNALKTP